MTVVSGDITSRRLGLFAGALAAGMIAVTAVSAQDFRISMSQTDANPFTKAYVAYVDYLNHNWDLEAKIFGAALVGAAEAPAALRDGIVSMAFVVTPYLPAEFAETNLVANLSMLATTGAAADAAYAAMPGAVMDYVLFNCPDCVAEFAAQNQLFISSASTTEYSLLCAQPIRTVQEMAGKKFRSGAANFGRWAESVGAVQVAVTSDEIYDGLTQGVIDCAMLSIADLATLSLFDVVKGALNGVPGGVFPVAWNNVNLDAWRALTDEQRAVILDGTADAIANIVQLQRANLELSTEKANEAGIEIIQPDQGIIDATDKFLKGDIEVIAAQFEAQYGISDAKQKIEVISGLIDKWKGLTNGVSDDRQALAKVYQEHIFSKLDPKTFGMN